MNDFWKENDLDGSKGDLRALGHPQWPRQAQPWGVQQVPFILIKILYGAWLYTILQNAMVRGVGKNENWVSEEQNEKEVKKGKEKEEKEKGESDFFF